MLDQLLADWKSVLFPDRESGALPVMDGALTPNGLLDLAAPIGEMIPHCDDLVCDEGCVFVSSGSQILELSGSGWRERRVHAELEGPVGPLALAQGALYAGVEGVGVLKLEQGRVKARLEAVAQQALHCPTAITLLPDGRIAIAEGSSANRPSAWCRDLMERRALGRIVVASSDLREATVLCDTLAWPYGLALSPDGASLWLSESWHHRVLSLSLDAGNRASPVTLLRNLPGYPARLRSDQRGGYWLSLFALRTHLVEMVLRETRYREEMLATIDPRYWIAPSLHATGHYLEPLQGGAIKKLGIVKPWAPPRSYGLAVQLSASGEILRSLHSRVGGRFHGVTSAQVSGESLLLVSKGSENLVACTLESTP